MGLAYAAQYRGDDAVVMVYFGDGATSEGDFHEALNFAGVWHVPVVFVCQNNQWAISVPLKKQTHSRTIAQKALAYGFPGIQVDGNDVLAVYAATREAVERARAGDGPTLIECVTYRLGVHTTADDPTKYRSEEEVAGVGAEGPADPLPRVPREARTCSTRRLEAAVDAEIAGGRPALRGGAARRSPRDVRSRVRGAARRTSRRQRDEMAARLGSGGAGRRPSRPPAADAVPCAASADAAMSRGPTRTPRRRWPSSTWSRR